MFSKKSIFLRSIQTSISDLFSSSSEASLKLQHTEEKRKHKIRRNLYFLMYNTQTFLHSLLTVVFGGMLGFWASAGFFMRAGLLGFGDIEKGLVCKEVSPFPSETSFTGTPANS